MSDDIPKTNMYAINAVINLLGDAIKDSLEALVPGESFVTKISNYENLLPDLVNMMKVIGQIPSGVSELKPEDYLTLVECLMKRVAISHTHAGDIIEECLTLLKGIETVVYPSLQRLFNSIKNPVG